MRTAAETDWKTRRLPSRSTAVRVERVFSQEEMHAIRRGLVPEAMEDKWFIYWKDDALFFHRSWTGYCIYVVHFAHHGDSWRMIQADVNRDPAQYSATSDTRDLKMISYLVDVLLLHRDAEFPDTTTSPDTLPLKMWSSVGRAMLGQHPGDGDTARPEDPSGTDEPSR